MWHSHNVKGLTKFDFASIKFNQIQSDSIRFNQAQLYGALSASSGSRGGLCLCLSFARRGLPVLSVKGFATAKARESGEEGERERETDRKERNIKISEI